MRPHVDVCVATYKRPELLAKLLRTLAAQETAGRFTFAVHVADNDVRRSGEPVVRAFAAEGAAISYGVEPTPSLSLARNLALSFARGDWIATTDDDLYVDRRWLLALHGAARAHDADVVHGPVVPEFARTPPDWVRDFHVRPNPPTGAGPGCYVFTAANALFRRALVADLPAPFDPRFGRTGGEDTDLFNRLRDRGCRMIWCREALAFALVPRERATVRWMLRRSFRHGIVAADAHRRPLNAGEVVGRVGAMGRLGVMSALYLAGGVADRELRQQGLRRLVTMLLYGAQLSGRVARHLRLQYEEYKPR